MKFKIQAIEDVSTTIGKTELNASKGDKLELSVGDFEIAMTTGKFRRVAEVPETPSETETLDTEAQTREAQKSAYLESSEKELHKQAKDLPGYKKSMNKDELADLILAPRAPAVVVAAKPETEGE